MTKNPSSRKCSTRATVRRKVAWAVWCDVMGTWFTGFLGISSFVAAGPSDFRARLAIVLTCSGIWLTISDSAKTAGLDGKACGWAHHFPLSALPLVLFPASIRLILVEKWKPSTLLCTRSDLEYWHGVCHMPNFPLPKLLREFTVLEPSGR